MKRSGKYFLTARVLESQTLARCAAVTKSVVQKYFVDAISSSATIAYDCLSNSSKVFTLFKYRDLHQTKRLISYRGSSSSTTYENACLVGCHAHAIGQNLDGMLAWPGKIGKDVLINVFYISIHFFLLGGYETTDTYLIETCPLRVFYLQSGILSTSSLRDFSSRSESSLSSCFLLRSAPSL